MVSRYYNKKCPKFSLDADALSNAAYADFRADSNEQDD